MTIGDAETLRAYCLGKPGATEDFPFGRHTLVFKVMGRTFALCGLNSTPLEVNLKCEPELAELLREKYQSITPGYHMNKRHWNTVTIDGRVPDAVVLELIDLSYELVIRGLRKADRDALQAPHSRREQRNESEQGLT
ncbi:MAG: MmcQ/YjbR family DNA-binding protein [Trueperaceae bacterium]